MKQGRLTEAVALFRESTQLCAGSPLNYAYLAVNLGHLGKIGPAREALAQFEAVTGVTVERWLHWQQVDGFPLEGVALPRGVRGE